MKQLLAIGLVVLLGSSLPAGTVTPLPLGSVRATGGYVLLNGIRAIPHTSVFPGDHLRAGPDASALITLKEGYLVVQGPAAILIDQGPEGIRVELHSGTVVVRQQPGQTIRVKLPGAEVRFASPDGASAVCTVTLAGQTSVACSRGRGEIWVAARSEPLLVPVGFPAIRPAHALSPNDEDDDDNGGGAWFPCAAVAGGTNDDDQNDDQNNDDQDDDAAGGALLLCAAVTGLGLTATLVPILVLAAEEEHEVSKSFAK